MAASCCASRPVEVRLRRAVVVQGVSLVLAEGRLAGAAGPQRHRQDHAAEYAGGRNEAPRRPHRARRADIGTLPSFKRAIAGIGWVPQERNIFRVADGGENLTAVAARQGRGRWTRLRDVPAPAGTARNLGNQLSGGEQQMLAVARALVLNPSCCCSTSRSKAWRPSSSRNCCARSARGARRRHVGHHRQAEPRLILPITQRRGARSRRGGARRRQRGAARRPTDARWTSGWRWRGTDTQLRRGAHSGG